MPNIPYNLGDFIRSRKYRENGWTNDKDYCKKFCEKYPNSICDIYNRLNINCKQRTIGYYDDYRINYALLNTIVNEKKAEMGIVTQDKIYIHLRVGDVIDNVQYNKGKTHLDYLKTQQTYRNGNNYVYPLAYYKNIEHIISNKIGKNVPIEIIAYKYDKNTSSNTYNYTMAIHNYFIKMGYNVTISYNDSVDYEFVLLCNSKYFVKSGGGFSFLIDKIRRYNKRFVI